MEPMRDYVEQRKGEYYVAATRVPLECVVQELQRGASPETIRESYPLLTLAQVYGAIAYYLCHPLRVGDAICRWARADPLALLSGRATINLNNCGAA